MTANQEIKWRKQLLEGKGNKYYPKELMGNLLNWNLEGEDNKKIKKKK